MPPPLLTFGASSQPHTYHLLSVRTIPTRTTLKREWGGNPLEAWTLPGDCRMFLPSHLSEWPCMRTTARSLVAARTGFGRTGVRGTPSSQRTSHPSDAGSTVTGQPWGDAPRAWTNDHADTRSAPEAGRWGGRWQPLGASEKIEEARHAIPSAGSPDDSGSGAQPGVCRGDGGVQQQFQFVAFLTLRLRLRRLRRRLLHRPHQRLPRSRRTGRRSSAARRRPRRRSRCCRTGRSTPLSSRLRPRRAWRSRRRRRSPRCM